MRDLGVYWPIQAVLVVGEPLYDEGKPLTEQQVIFFEGFLVFWPIQAVFVVGEPVCDVEIPSSVLITVLT